jgi:PDZ domain-containing secreted protein
MGTLSANASRTAVFFFWLITVKTRAMDLRTTLLQFFTHYTELCQPTAVARTTRVHQHEKHAKGNQQSQPACLLSSLPQANQQLKHGRPIRHAKTTKEKSKRLLSEEDAR